MDALTASHLSSTEYDFILVGGGTAGLVVASRLTEDPDVHVLVLEAGENHLADPRINIPAGWSAVLGSDVDWNFKTTPQESLKGRTLRHPQGRILGGSSAINAEAFIAPSKADIEGWGSFGNPGWNWATMMPYYRKFHTLTIPSKETCEHLGIDWIDGEVRGTTGPIQASFQGVVQDPLSQAWVKTFRNLDYDLKGDPFSGEAMGGYSSPITVDPESKTRSYAANTYFVAASKRPNLHVVTGALVNKVLLDTKNDLAVATGVSVTVQGNNDLVAARKEVILAAGAFQTPKLLELSGIGSKAILQSHNIPILVDNPNVGENLQDHLMTGISFEVKDGIFTGDGLMRQEPEVLQGAMQMYSTARAGPLCAGGIGSYAFMPIVDFIAEGGRADLKKLLTKFPPDTEDEMHYAFVRSILENASSASGALFMFPAQVNLHNNPEAKDFLQDLLPGNYVSLGAALLHPFSRGNVHIASADATQAPKIDPKYLSHPLDVEVLARHLRMLETLAESQPFVSLLKPDGRRNHATAHVKDLANAKEYVKTTVISNNHPACTCAMMPKEKGGVVNERLLVHGTRNLRIVDASIMPTIPRGNIQSSVYAVAERAADLIKGVC